MIHWLPAKVNVLVPWNRVYSVYSFQIIVLVCFSLNLDPEWSLKQAVFVYSTARGIMAILCGMPFQMNFNIVAWTCQKTEPERGRLVLYVAKEFLLN